MVAYPVIGCADGSCRLHSRSRLTNPSSRNRNATSHSALLGGDHAGVLQVGVRAFRGPFAALSTPQFTNIFRFNNAFRDLLTLYSAPLHFFSRFSFFCSIHRGRPRQLYRFWSFPFFLPLFANIRQEPRGHRLARLLFQDLPRTLSKFLEILDLGAPHMRELSDCELPRTLSKFFEILTLVAPHTREL